MNDKNMLISCALIFVLLAGGCLTYESFRGTAPETPETRLGLVPEKVEIQLDIETYSPAMSSTVGIGLTPAYTLEEDPKTVRFHWRANYGYFINWGPPDHKVRILGNETVNDGGKIYWSYDPADFGLEKPQVLVHLTVEDADSNRVLTEKTLELEWENQGTVKVKSGKLP